MPPSLCLSLALVLQPPSEPATGETSAQVAKPLDRGYQGPTSVRLPEPGLEPTDAPTTTTAAPRARRSDADGSSPPAIFIDVQGYPPPAHGRPSQPPPPRTLTTIDGPAAQASIRGERPVVFRPGLQIRTRLGAVSPLRIDEAGNRVSEGLVTAGRVRWHPELGIGPDEALRVVGMLDLAQGRWAPATIRDPLVREIARDDHAPIPTELRVIDPRELHLRWRSDYGVLKVGQQAFGWGLGLYANDGDNMNRFGDLKFGNDGDGTLLERISFSSRPLADQPGPIRDIVVGLAADLVYRDPQADLVQGDLAGQGLLMMRWEPRRSPGARLGGFVAYRHQHGADDANEDRLQVLVADLAGRGYRRVGPVTLLGAFEAVLIGGRTTRFRGAREELRILRGGIAARGFVGDPDGWLAGADGGWFSGDSDPDDGRLGGFEAAGGYTAGLLSFQHLRGWQSARSAQLSAGNDGDLATRGRVGNVVFAHPKGRWAFADRFEVWGGPLLAAASSPVIDPVQTRSSGTPSNAYGAPVRGRLLATELDLGLRAQYDVRDLWLQAGVQGGVLFPGRALEDARGGREDPAYGGWLRVELRY